MLTQIIVDTSGSSMLSFLEVAAMGTPRSLNFSRGWNSIPYPHFSNSHGIISFADPHLLNPFTSYRYKKHGGRGVAHNLQTYKPSNLLTRSIPLSPLSATLTNMPISVDSKELTEKINPLDATLTKNSGE